MPKDFKIKLIQRLDDKKNKTDIEEDRDENQQFPQDTTEKHILCVH